MTSTIVDPTLPGGIERIAYHEAGHVAIRRHFDHCRQPFRERGYVLISNSMGGYGRTGLGSGNNLWVPVPQQPPPVDQASITEAMGGRAAEAIRYPDLPRDELIRLSVLSDEPLARCYIRVLYGGNLSDQDVTDRIVEAEAEASVIVRGVWAGVAALAETLLVRLQTAAGDQIEITGVEALHAMSSTLGFTPL
jgi:hypothetical protein